MKVAFLIPHVFRGDDSGSLHGSSWEHARETRSQIFDQVIFQIHSLWGRRHTALDGPELKILAGANPFAVDFEIFVFTTGDLHLLDNLATRHMVTHIATEAEPMLVGFECAKWIRDHLNEYDYYFYLEDDLLIHDPLFLIKIENFNRLVAGSLPNAVLQPQRYELSLLAADPNVIKDIDRLYIDYANRDLTPPVGPPITLTFLGISIEFEPALNPHSGCYIISNRQAEMVVAHPDFLTLGKMYDFPLDTAATAFIAQALTVYKPARQSLSFLEIQHGHQVCLRMDET